MSLRASWFGPATTGECGAARRNHLALAVVEQDGCAALRGVVDADAIEALEAFVIANGAAAFDRVVRAAVATGLAGLAAFTPAHKPVEATQLAAEGDSGTERA